MSRPPLGGPIAGLGAVKELSGRLAGFLQKLAAEDLMRATHLIQAATLCCAIAVAGVACNKNKQAAPDAQMSTGLQPRSQPVTVTGCLQKGTIAENTWVLISDAAAAGTTGRAPTYQLTGAHTDSLGKNVGQRVEVSGIVQAEQEVASNSGTVPENRAKGTSGTPTVQTKTDVDIRRLEVTSVKPTGDRCQ